VRKFTCCRRGSDTDCGLGNGVSNLGPCNRIDDGAYHISHSLVIDLRVHYCPAAKFTCRLRAQMVNSREIALQQRAGPCEIESPRDREGDEGVDDHRLCGHGQSEEDSRQEGRGEHFQRGRGQQTREGNSMRGLYIYLSTAAILVSGSESKKGGLRRRANNASLSSHLSDDKAKLVHMPTAGT
jgi:hypothetical protein